MRFFRTILLSIIALVCLAAIVVLTIDGNLSRLTGHNIFTKGERIFPYSKAQIDDVSWMRIRVVNDRAEALRDDKGIWFLSTPWADRMDPRAAAAILQFTYSTALVDELPLNNTVKGSMREFGIETTPIELTLKNKSGKNRFSTMARYILGSTAPWILEDNEGNTNDTTYIRTDFYGNNDNILVTSGNILPMFKEGIRQLRDHRPLLLPPAVINLPSQPKRIVIKHEGHELVLSRTTFGSPWKLESPLSVAAAQQTVTKLLNGLHKLTASRVYNPEETTLPEVKESEITSITLDNFAGDPPLVLKLYPSDTPSAKTVKATVSDRKAVFDIPIASSEELPGVEDLPLRLNQLRTQTLCSISNKDIKGIAIRSKNGFPIALRLLPQGREGSTNKAPEWVYTAEDANQAPINESQLFRLMKTLLEESVYGFSTDNPTDLSDYGLDQPEVTVSILQSNNKLSVFIFGQAKNESWYAMEQGTPSVYQVSPSYVASFPAESLYWKQNKLFNFSRFDLRQLSLERVGQPPLVLNYDYLDDTWQATQDGKDVTVSIDNNRANRYLSELERMKVAAWLPFTDADAAEALKTPVFRLKIVLDPNQAEINIIDGDNPAAGQDQAMKPTELQEKVLEIAPAGEAGHTSFYFGKMSDYPYYFILNMNEVRILGASVFEQN